MKPRRNDGGALTMAPARHDTALSSVLSAEEPMATTHSDHALPRAPRARSTQGVRMGIWLSTGLFSLMFSLSGAAFLVGPGSVVTMFHHLGYPDYFRHLLGVAKLLGVAALVTPLPSPTLREWAYAGFAFTCIGAAASHLLTGDPFGKALGSLVALGLLLTSYFLRRRAAVSNPASV
jgi:hypothetical protein